MADTLAALRAAGGGRRSTSAPTSRGADDRARLLDAVPARFGALNALVNNAGRAPRVRADLLDASEESFEEVLRTNLQGPYFLTQAIARDHDRRARKQSPASPPPSSSSRRCRPRWRRVNRGEYCVSKAGLAMAARLFAVRLAPDGIPVYEVRPGIIATDMTAGVHETSTTSASPTASCPSGRWGQPEDVGRAVAALLRGDLPYATGTVIHVDGGLSIPRL